MDGTVERRSDGVDEPVDVVLVAEYDDGFAGVEHIIGLGHRQQVGGAVLCLNGEDADVVVGADADFADGFADPFARHRNLIDGVVGRQLVVIEHRFGTQLDGQAVGPVLFGINRLVRADEAQQFGVRIAVRAGNDVFRAVFFQQRRRLERILEVVADGDDTHVKVIDAQGGDVGLAGDMPDFRVGDVRQDFVDLFLVHIDGQDIVVVGAEHPRQVFAEPAQPDEQNGFHVNSSVIK